jgi:PAS domain S-box-containing protein
MESAGQYHLLEAGGRFILRTLLGRVERDNPSSSRANLAVITLDVAGFITGWNRQAVELFDYSNGEAQALNIYHFLPTAEAASGDFERHLGDAYHNGKAQFRYGFHRKDGTRFSGSCELKPIWHRSSFHGYIFTVNPDRSQQAISAV